ncbi:MAG TPA: LAGLIDADG family homing endonuclease, partial [Roseiflexaceae bacterium]|nr:LAGLIDADG family homing endonuclease [Roseiflexaceae bacterium]
DRVKISGGQNLWAQQPVQLTWQPQRRVSLQSVAALAGIDIETVIRYRQGVRGRHSETLAPLVAEYDRSLATLGRNHNHRNVISVPTVVDERLAALLGYMCGDGHISEVKRTIGLTTGDENQAQTFANLVSSLFGIEVHRRWDPNRWRLSFSSVDVQGFLKHLGLKTGVAAREKNVPDVILRSPKPVVASFVRALYDCDGYAGKAGVILSTSSEQMGKTVQLLLLNFGVLSTRRLQADGCWYIHTTGRSAVDFYMQIGFGLERKQQALAAYIEDRRWFQREDWTDEIGAIEHGRADVYDISVTDTHRYAAQGFINHNSFWHSEIMTRKALKDGELVDFADHHS